MAFLAILKNGYVNVFLIRG